MDVYFLKKIESKQRYSNVRVDHLFRDDLRIFFRSILNDTNIFFIAFNVVQHHSIYTLTGTSVFPLISRFGQTLSFLVSHSLRTASTETPQSAAISPNVLK